MATQRAVSETWVIGIGREGTGVDGRGRERGAPLVPARSRPFPSIPVYSGSQYHPSYHDSPPRSQVAARIRRKVPRRSRRRVDAGGGHRRGTPLQPPAQRDPAEARVAPARRGALRVPGRGAPRAVRGADAPRGQLGPIGRSPSTDPDTRGTRA